MGGLTYTHESQPAEESARPVSYFRGYRSIQDFVRERKLDDFATWLKAYKPNCHEITISRTHYDLVRRWPRAAGLLGFIVTFDAVYYKSFKLKPDFSTQRYKKPPGPTQSGIEG